MSAKLHKVAVCLICTAAGLLSAKFALQFGSPVVVTTILLMAATLLILATILAFDVLIDTLLGDEDDRK